MAENIEISFYCGDYDETVKRLPLLFKNLRRVIDYLIIDVKRIFI